MIYNDDDDEQAYHLNEPALDEKRHMHGPPHEKYKMKRRKSERSSLVIHGDQAHQKCAQIMHYVIKPPKSLVVHFSQ